MSTSNAMRQGLSMSFIFLAFVASSRRSYFWMIIFCCISILTHKSGLVLAAIVIFAPIVKNFLSVFSSAKQDVVHFLIGTFLLISAFFSLAF